MLIEWISHPESITRSDQKLENFLPWESNSLTNLLDPGIFSRFFSCLPEILIVSDPNLKVSCPNKKYSEFGPRSQTINKDRILVSRLASFKTVIQKTVQFQSKDRLLCV